MTDSQQSMRDFEVAVDVPQRTDAEIIYIGRIYTPYMTLGDCPRQGDIDDGPVCEIEIFPPWDAALDGIEDCSDLEIFYWLHLSRRDLVRQSPRSSDKSFSTFTLRSPIRPNPIGVSTVKLQKVEGNRLYVQGLDCLNDTPLIDIKPPKKRGKIIGHSRG